MPIQNPRKPSHKIDTYGRWKKQAQKYHQFTNRRTKNLTPQDKAAISKAYDGYVDRKTGKKVSGLKHHIDAVNEGRAVFVPATSAQIRNLKKLDQYVATNKGVFVYGTNIEKVKIKGRGKDTQLEIQKPQRLEQYFSVKPSFANIVDLVNWIWEAVKPHAVRIAYNQFTAARAHSKRMWINYESDLQEIEDGILGQGYNTPYHGAFAIWHR